VSVQGMLQRPHGDDRTQARETWSGEVRLAEMELLFCAFPLYLRSLTALLIQLHLHQEAASSDITYTAFITTRWPSLCD
jgi:hypothetical protein